MDRDSDTTMKMKNILGIAIMFLFFAVLAGNASALTTIDSCQGFLTENEIYLLNTSISTSSSCFGSGANNVTLDCGGYAVEGTDNYITFFGVGRRNDTTVQNCNVSGFRYIFSSPYNMTIKNSYLETGNGNPTAVVADNGAGAVNSNVFIYNSTMVGGGAGQKYIAESYGITSVYMINTTTTSFSGCSGASCYIQWYYSISVKDSSDNSPIPNAVISVSDTGGITNYTGVVTDSSGVFSTILNQNNPILVSGSHSGYFSNSTSFSISDNGNFNLYLEPLTFGLLSPPDNNINDTNAMAFTYNGVKNEVSARLWGNFSGVWAGNQTNTSTGLVQTTIPDGIYSWTIESCNTSCYFAPENRTLRIDSVPVSESIQSPSNTSYSTNKFWFNLSASNNADTCIVDYGAGNKTMALSGGIWAYYDSAVIGGTHTAIFYCNNSLGVWNSASVVFTIGNTVYLDSCVSMLDNDTVYKLSNDILETDANSFCFYVNGLHDVTLDCNGYGGRFNGTWSGETTFFKIDDSTNVTLRNCVYIDRFAHVSTIAGTQTYLTKYVYYQNLYNITNLPVATYDDFFEDLSAFVQQNIVASIYNVTFNSQYATTSVNAMFASSKANITVYAYNFTNNRLNNYMFVKFNTGTNVNVSFYRLWYADISLTDFITGESLTNANINVHDIANFANISTNLGGNSHLTIPLYQYWLNYYGNSFTLPDDAGTQIQLNPQNITGSNSGYYTNSSLFNITGNMNYILEMQRISYPLIDPSSIVFQLVITLGFGIMGLFAVMTLFGFGYITATGKPDPETIAKIMIGVVIIILMIVAVWTGIVTPP